MRLVRAAVGTPPFRPRITDESPTITRSEGFLAIQSSRYRCRHDGCEEDPPRSAHA